MEVEKEYREIPLDKGLVAKVDPEDYERFKGITWTAKEDPCGFYARGKIRGKKFYLHRLIMGATKGQRVDHRSGDTLDCRRDNLRVCTHAQNARNRGLNRNNSTGWKGVHQAASGRFFAQIGHDGCRKALGTFDTQEEAAKAYDEAAMRHFGAFARTNLKVSGYGWLGDTPDDPKSITTEPRKPVGERHYQARLKLTQVIEIKAAEDAHYPTLAQRYGVTVATICDIRRGRTWKHAA